MKKTMQAILLLLVLALCPVVVQAQSSGIEDILARAKKTAQEEKANELARQVADSLNTNATPQARTAQHKRWQIAIFDALEWTLIDDTLDALKDQVKKGNLQQASVLLATDKSNKGNFYFIYRANGDYKLESTPVDLKENAGILVKTLLQHFKDTPDVYTGFIVHAHGSGAGMTYGHDGDQISTRTITDRLKELNLYADIMDLESCHMGSIQSVYAMAESRKVRYALVSSNVGSGTSYALLSHLNMRPKEAIFAVHQNKLKQAQWHKRLDYTHNSLLLDLSILRGDLIQWQIGYQLINDSNLDRNLSRVFGNNDWLSFKWVVMMQEGYVRNNSHLYSRAGEFIQDSEKLLSTLDEALLSQWCYSHIHHKIYTQAPFPEDSECMNGISTEQGNIEWLLKQ